MKKIIIIITVALLTILPLLPYGQSPDNVPPPPDDKGQSGNQPQGVAPIGGGIAFLVAMGAAYGGKKYYDYRKKLKNEMDD